MRVQSSSGTPTFTHNAMLDKKHINDKLKEFLNLSKEEKHNIDNNPKYDGLFSIIDEMSSVVLKFYKSKDKKDL